MNYFYYPLNYVQLNLKNHNYKYHVDNDIPRLSPFSTTVHNSRQQEQMLVGQQGPSVSMQRQKRNLHQELLALKQGLSTFLIVGSFNTFPHVVVTPNHKIIFIAMIFATIMNNNVNIFGNKFVNGAVTHRLRSTV